MDVLFAIIGDNQVASTRYRVLNIVPHLDDINYDVFSLAEFKSDHTGSNRMMELRYSLELVQRARQYDTVFVQKLVLPPTYFGSLTGGYFRLLRTAAGRVIYDLDDAQYLGRHGSEVDTAMRKKVNAILRQADTVTAGSEEIGDYTKQFADTHILSPALPKEDYEGRQANVGEQDQIRIGWIGNPENLRYLRVHEEVLREVLNQNPSTTLEIVTNLDASDKPLADREDVVYHQWSRSKELDYLEQFQVAIRPLTDDEWTRSKGGFVSVLQCMGLNLPVVVTPVGELQKIVDDGESGLYATKDEEWKIALERLIDEPKLRERLGNAGYRRIEELGRWSENYADELSRILRNEV